VVGFVQYVLLEVLVLLEVVVNKPEDVVKFLPGYLNLLLLLLLCQPPGYLSPLLLLVTVAVIFRLLLVVLLPQAVIREVVHDLTFHLIILRLHYIHLHYLDLI
jgi:hypothetical protein